MLIFFRKMLYTGCALAVSLCVAFTFYQELSALTLAAQVIAAGLAFLVVTSAWIALHHTLVQLGKLSACIIGATIVGGLALSLGLNVETLGVKSATLIYSDGHTEERAPAAKISGWGRTVDGYNMHPAYGTALVLNALTVDISDNPSDVTLLISKPRAALYKTGRESTGSDGISIDLHVYNREGDQVSVESFLVPQQEFLDEKWVKKRIISPNGISSIHLVLGTGPPGSSPDYDSTIIAFEMPSPHSGVAFLSKIVTISLCLFFMLLLGTLILQQQIPIIRTRRGMRSAIFHTISVLTLVELIIFWSQSETSYVFFWDFRNYWQKTEALYELLNAGSWGQAVQLFSSSYASDYSMLPAVVPALISLAVGYPTRMVYTLIIGAVYAVPAYLSVVYLAKTLVEDTDRCKPPHVQLGCALAFLAVYLGLPLFFGTTLFLMPDIGGVALFVISLMNAFQITNEITRQQKIHSPQLSTALISSSISLGLMFSLMFIFRRWYVFAAVGITVSLFIQVCWDMLRPELARRTLLKRAITSALLMLATAAPFMCWILFVWSKDFGKHDYSQLYASYKNPLFNDGAAFVANFGFVTLLLCLIGGIMLCRYGRDRRLLFLLTASSVIACALFLSIQSPGIHHFYLAMPLLGAFIASLVLYLYGRFGSVVPILLCSLMAAGGVWTTFYGGSHYGVTAFGGYNRWIPQHQKYVDGYSDLTAWLDLPDNKNEAFCLIASSAEINQGIFLELWQLLPHVAKHAFDTRLIQLGQVDSVDGPPSPNIKKCTIFLVAVPFQTHMQPNQQLNLQIIQQDMLTGTGIGAAVVRPPSIFMMDKHIEIRAFKTARPITELEYGDLVKRFVDAKGGNYINPAQMK